MTHTPGPWHWVEYDGDRELVTVDGTAVVYHAASWPLHDANETLIAAAPELLAALEMMMPVLGRIWGDDALVAAMPQDVRDRFYAAGDAVRTAIAKAKGQPS